MSIEIKNVSKSFDGKTVLDDFSLIVEEGRTVCLMAPSGRGKTTLARILLGLEIPDSGTVEGVPSDIAAVFQEDRLCESLTVVKNIKIACPKVDGEEISSHLNAVGIVETKKQRAGELSGGQKRRVSLVRAILADADFIVFDEPFSGLDSDTRKTVISYMKNHLKGKTSLVITHDKNDAEALEANVIEL